LIVWLCKTNILSTCVIKLIKYISFSVKLEKNMRCFFERKRIWDVEDWYTTQLYLERSSISQWWWINERNALRTEVLDKIYGGDEDE